MARLEFDRRTALRGAGVTAMIAAGAQLTGCNNAKHEANTATNNQKVSLPKFIPVEDVHPDMRGTAAGVPDAFLTFPKPVAKKAAAPGRGDTVTAMLETGAPIGPVSKNPFWQQLNRRLGVDLKLNGILEDGYADKLAVTVAGGDIPDCVQLHPDMPRLPDLLNAKFADLTEFLSGDAISEYPFLANIPAYAWPNAVYNGRIYGVPYSLAPVGAIMYTRSDILDKEGISTDVKSGQEFIDLCRSISSQKHGRWAHCNPPGFLAFVLEMLGKPAGWTQEKGKFTRSYERPEYKRALEIVSKEWKRGEIFHPDSFSLAGTKQEDFFANGTTLFDFRANTFWQNYYVWYGATFPQLELGAVLPVDFDGKGMGAKGLGTGAYTFTALKKASKDRIREMLRIMNYTASPFGTEQYMFIKFGIKGRDYTMEKGEPVPTKVGSEVALPISYIAARPPVLYTPGHPDATRNEYEYQKKVFQYGVKDASTGLTSDTYSRKNTELETAIGDVVTGILQGNRSLSDWDSAVRKWRSDGGDQIREEYEKSYADVHG